MADKSRSGGDWCVSGGGCSDSLGVDFSEEGFGVGVAWRFGHRFGCWLGIVVAGEDLVHVFRAKDEREADMEGPVCAFGVAGQKWSVGHL